MSWVPDAVQRWLPAAITEPLAFMEAVPDRPIATMPVDRVQRNTVSPGPPSARAGNYTAVVADRPCSGVRQAFEDLEATRSLQR